MDLPSILSDVTHTLQPLESTIHKWAGSTHLAPTDGHQLYQSIGKRYSGLRRPDPRIERPVPAALGDAGSVVNVGAGTGNYEPAGRRVCAIEPSPTRISQRKPKAAPPVLAVTQALPFGDNVFDAALAILTLHHWANQARGLSEPRRVARRQVVLIFEPWVPWQFWLVEYLPECLRAPSEKRALSIDDLCAYLYIQSGLPVPVPADCIDGFAGAYWCRPEQYLDQSVREEFPAWPSCRQMWQNIAPKGCVKTWRQGSGRPVSDT